MRESVCRVQQTQETPAGAHGRETVPMHVRGLRQEIQSRFQSTVSEYREVFRCVMFFFAARTFVSTRVIDRTSVRSTGVIRSLRSPRILRVIF